jgi:hypothetical protein
VEGSSVTTRGRTTTPRDGSQARALARGTFNSAVDVARGRAGRRRDQGKRPSRYCGRRSPGGMYGRVRGLLQVPGSGRVSQSLPTRAGSSGSGGSWTPERSTSRCRGHGQKAGQRRQGRESAGCRRPRSTGSITSPSRLGSCGLKVSGVRRVDTSCEVGSWRRRFGEHRRCARPPRQGQGRSAVVTGALLPGKWYGRKA